MIDPDLVAIDVGNTTTAVGVFVGEDLAAHVRLSTDPDRTTDEYGAILTSLLERSGLSAPGAKGLIISSVVPPLQATYARLSKQYFGCDPIFVEPGIRTGISIRSDNPSEVGADRIVNAVAARESYGTPVIVVDFGTALTFDIVNTAGEYVGGIIAPGIGIASEALFAQASRLYRVDIKAPSEVVGRTTVGAMQSGLYYGWMGLVDVILERLFDEFPEIDTVVGTGGQAQWIAEGSKHLRQIDPNLTLQGLRLIYELNRGR